MTKPTKKKAGPGRPRKVISPEDMAKAERYAFNGCQNETIEGLMDWSHDFINKRPDISRILTKKRQERKNYIREAQLNQVNTPVMAIWLGKNDLGQSDKTETRHDVAESLQEFITWLKGRENG